MRGGAEGPDDAVDIDSDARAAVDLGFGDVERGRAEREGW